MKLNKLNNIETSNRLKTHKSIDINKIIVEKNLNNNIYHINNNKSNKFFYIGKIRNIILFSITTSIIIGAILFYIYYILEINNKTLKSYKHIKNNTIDIDGYYIPKDKLSNPYYKKCSVESCKKCYGNSYNDICLSCIKSYAPIMNEENKIIYCKYNPKKEFDTYITSNESNIINIPDNIIEEEFKSNLITKNITEFTKEIESISNNIIIHDNITSIEIESSATNNHKNNTESVFYKSTESKIELSTQIILEQKHQTTYIETIEPITINSIIINCEPGYYLPKGNYKECKPCSIFGCEKCHGNNTINYCDSCFSKYIPRLINNNLICSYELDSNCDYYDSLTLECFKCKDEYVLYERKCHAYSLGAIYKTTENNQYIKLIRLDTLFIEKIIIDDMIINPLEFDKYTVISKKGYHNAYYFITNNPKSFQLLFDNCINLVSVNFTSHFNSSNITNLSYMFYLCSSLISVRLSGFDTFNVKTMSYMFYGCKALYSIYLQSFNTVNVEYMNEMFRNCYSLKYLDLGHFNAQKVKEFYGTFYNCHSLTSLILPYTIDFKISQLTATSYMFYNCSKLTSINFDKLNLTNVKNMGYMFYGCYSLKELRISSYYNGPHDLNPKNVQYLYYTFYNCSCLTRVNISNWNLEKVIQMNNMFEYCSSLETIIFPKFNANQLKNIEYIFSNCISLKHIDLSTFQNTYNLVNMSHMFENSSIIKIELLTFNFTNVKDISFMLAGCKNLTSVNFKNFHINSLIYTNSLFYCCYSFSSGSLGGLNTEKVIDMSRMFYNCSSIQSASLNFNTSKVINMDEMFYGCSKLNFLNITTFVGDSLLSNKDMFGNTNITTLISKKSYLNKFK